MTNHPKPPGPREFWLRQYSQDGGMYSDIRVMKPSDCDLGVSPPPGHDNLKYYDEVHVIEKRAYDAVVAELAGAKASYERLDNWHHANGIHKTMEENRELRSACEMLAKVLESVELYPNGHTNMRVKAALAQYEALKRQLAGEGVSREPKG